MHLCILLCGIEKCETKHQHLGNTQILNRIKIHNQFHFILNGFFPTKQVSHFSNSSNWMMKDDKITAILLFKYFYYKSFHINESQQFTMNSSIFLRLLTHPNIVDAVLSTPNRDHIDYL